MQFARYGLAPLGRMIPWGPNRACPERCDHSRNLGEARQGADERIVWLSFPELPPDVAPAVASLSQPSSEVASLVTITESSPDSITEIPQALIGVVGLFGV
jgi:hypothetical protein